jgi:hypothetical protein
LMLVIHTVTDFLENVLVQYFLVRIWSDGQVSKIF